VKHTNAKLKPGVQPKVFMATTGWLQRFAARVGIVPRSKSNSKSSSVVDRLPKYERWLRQLMAMLKEDRPDTRAQFDTIFGRFLPDLRANIDQMPMSFCFELDSTYEYEGAKTVQIKEPGDGSFSKRQATLMLFITAGAGDQPRAAIIFRGKGMRISDVEKENWDKRIDVYFQQNAWADTPFLVAWARKTLKQFTQTLNGRRLLLFCDNLKGHLSDEFKAACSERNVLLWYLLKNTTDFSQPIDAGYGRDVKREIAKQQSTWLENDENLARWESGQLNAKERRILMTEWVCFCVISIAFSYCW
jgi:hypothetical protein